MTRNKALDILRGVALLAILIVNLRSFRDITLLNTPLDKIIDLYIRPATYPLFSFLFGLGIFQQMSKYQNGFRRLHNRRMLVLGLFGVLHGVLLFPGDILALYAVYGALISLVIKRTRRVLIVATVLALTGLLIAPYFENTQYTMPGDSIERVTIWLQDAIGQFVGGSFTIAPMMLIGVLYGHLGLFNRRQQAKHAMILLGSLVSAGALSTTFMIRGVTPLAWVTVLPGLTVAYISGVYLIVSYSRALDTFAPVGKMSLSHYVAQSGLLNIVWIGRGDISNNELLLIALVFYAGQVQFSRAWLRYFDNGALEMIWRRAVYGFSPQLAS
jgi:uncharacterized protein